MLNFVTRFSDRTIAEDITQEVFLRVYRAAPRFQPKAKVSTSIFQIAYNQALSEIGRHKRQRNLNENWHLKQGRKHPGKPLGHTERYELEEEIMSVLGRLPDNQRAALLLRTNEGLSYREIGTILGVSIQSVESLLFRARTSLKRYLNRK